MTWWQTGSNFKRKNGERGGNGRFSPGKKGAGVSKPSSKSESLPTDGDRRRGFLGLGKYVQYDVLQPADGHESLPRGCRSKTSGGSKLGMSGPRKGGRGHRGDFTWSPTSTGGGGSVSVFQKLPNL